MFKQSYNDNLKLILTEGDVPKLGENDLLIDAILGAGLNRSITGLCSEVIYKVNQQSCFKIAIDIPSGMHADIPNYKTILEVDDIFTIEEWKASFYYRESNDYFKNIETVSIGLDKEYISESKAHVIEEVMVKKLFSKRPKFSHKGNYGNGLIIAGSTGMKGAAILSSKSALACGIGKLTIGSMGHTDLYVNVVPEAMSVDIQDFKIDIKRYDTIAIGPGIGVSMHMANILDNVLISNVSLILDADALNIIAKNSWLNILPKGTIITPHPKEFERLFGVTNSHYEMVKLQKEMSKKHGLFIVLKMAHTSVTDPDGNVFFNTTGNPGMAKGGSGDVLTGMILGYLGWMNHPLKACIAAVYNHGKAGDLAKVEKGEVSMQPSDIISHLHGVHLDYE
jgi:ADP-dependent NAD(P)H-hydrate dehydratase / NAD(P)H-hydrate epimerase